jgi:hypothetical protein
MNTQLKALLYSIHIKDRHKMTSIHIKDKYRIPSIHIKEHIECEILPSCNEISSHIGDGDENRGSKKIKKNIDTPCKDVSCDELEFEDFEIFRFLVSFCTLSVLMTASIFTFSFLSASSSDLLLLSLFPLFSLTGV